jgi:hypothetical protein
MEHTHMSLDKMELILFHLYANIRRTQDLSLSHSQTTLSTIKKSPVCSITWQIIHNLITLTVLFRLNFIVNKHKCSVKNCLWFKHYNRNHVWFFFTPIVTLLSISSVIFPIYNISKLDDLPERKCPLPFFGWTQFRVEEQCCIVIRCCPTCIRVH